MDYTNLKCSCGKYLSKHYSRPCAKSKSASYDLCCWDCGFIYKRNGNTYKLTEEGQELKVGRHNLVVLA